jgi:chitin synthase
MKGTEGSNNTNNNSNSSNPTKHRKTRSLVRPERSRSRRPSRSRTREHGVRENDFEGFGADGRFLTPWYSCWPLTYTLLTCWIPGWALAKFGRMEDERVQRAWREKVALCIIIGVLCLALGFLTFGFTSFVCVPPKKPVFRLKVVGRANNEHSRWFIVHGRIFNIPASSRPHGHRDFDPYTAFATRDISAYFPWTPACDALGIKARLRCRLPGSSVEYCHHPSALSRLAYVADVAYSWEEVRGSQRAVVNGQVLDFAQYLDQVRPGDASPPFGRDIDRLLRQYTGKDASRAFSALDPRLANCLFHQFRCGLLEVKTMGCIATDVVLYVSLVAILAVVLSKFFLAVAFAFIMAKKLGKPNARADEKGEPVEGDAEGRRPGGTISTVLKSTRYSKAIQRPARKAVPAAVPPTLAQLDSTNSTTHMYAILLVTCYSESAEGLRTTLDSLAETEYDDTQKLLVVIADGIIRGSGNDRATPDILVDMLELAHDRFEGFHYDEEGRPHAYSYVALADGIKRHNMARVYAGYYRSGEHCVPLVLVVKGGGPTELGAAKPGNRGKRDSQIVLMSFLSKVLFDDRMTPLEYDLFFKIVRLTGVMPDMYEVVLMVDADTKVMPQSLAKLVQVMKNDTTIMGLCGETRIANKTTSWVTMIQVFEYYISHHMSKAFESIFGGVTCLPGCFCMYRVKAPKGGGHWVPILASPDIVDSYSENITDTLHKKNLLLLGEDRYLTTLMLKTFPKRKMVFVPHAVCKTMVPDEFRILLSQRRRWINSTIHNLFELVLVSDLCGTFCCSMQFVVFMELVGTLVLPAAITFTGVLIVSTFVTTPQYIPLFLLAAILGLPALLILFTTKNPMYCIWFLIYILALPLWNFVLPLYAFWHFDDFSWGETRKLAGAAAKGADDHGKAEGLFDSSQIFMKRWHEFEQERLAKTERWRATEGGFGDNTLKPLVDPLAERKAQEAQAARLRAEMEAKAAADAERARRTGFLVDEFGEYNVERFQQEYRELLSPLAEPSGHLQERNFSLSIPDMDASLGQEAAGEGQQHQKGDDDDHEEEAEGQEKPKKFALFRRKK